MLLDQTQRTKIPCYAPVACVVDSLHHRGSLDYIYRRFCDTSRCTTGYVPAAGSNYISHIYECFQEK